MTKKKEEGGSSLFQIKSLWTRFPILLSLLWFLIIVPTYIFHHPYYSQSVSSSGHWGLLLVLGVLFTAAYLLFVKAKWKWSTLNGWKGYVLFLVLTNCTLVWYATANGLFTSNPVYHIAHFTGRMLLLHLAVLFVTILGYATGMLLLSPFSNKLKQGSRNVIAIALGWSVIAFVMVLLGMLNILHPIALWVLLLAIGLPQYRSIWQFLQSLLLRPIQVSTLNTQGFLSVAILLVFLGVNALGAIKAFPAGFDGAGLYMNTTKLIGEYQALPKGGQAFNWSVVMSMGNLLFGSMTVAILLSNLMGVFCVFVIYQIARLILSPSNALMAGAIFYTMPAVTFHNYVDEKVDLGFLFVSLCSILLFLEFWLTRKANGTNHKKELILLKRFKIPKEWLLWILLGWLSGFAFGIKYSALFQIIGLLVLCFYHKAGPLAFAGSLLTSLGLLFGFNIHRFAGLDLAGSSAILLGTLLLVPGIALMIWAFRSSFQRLLEIGILVGVFVMAIGINYAPWATKHSFENRSVAISALLEGKSPEPKLKIKPRFRKEPKSSNVGAGRKKRAAKSQSALQTRREELQRYQGFEKGLPLYLSLPYDLTMNTNLVNRSYLDIGFLWLLLLPLLMLSTKPRSLLKNGLWSILL
ncbi:MAG: hypothetical protein AAF705_16920, partial [Bacteroidota bacterium]